MKDAGKKEETETKEVFGDSGTKTKKWTGPGNIPFVQDYDPPSPEKKKTYPGEIPGSISKGGDPYKGKKDELTNVRKEDPEEG